MGFPVPVVQMLAQRMLRLAVVASLENAAQANGWSWNVDSPGAWPTPGVELQPNVVAFKVKSGDEVKNSVDPAGTVGVFKFNTDCDLVVEAQLQTADQVSAQNSIEALRYTVENLLLTDFSINSAVQRVNSVQTRTEIDGEGRQFLASFYMTLSLQVYEEFDPAGVPPPASTWPLTPNPIMELTGIGLQMDLRNVFDPNGTYHGAEFEDEAVPAPRRHGPDGRVEAGLLFTNLNFYGPGGLDQGYMLDVSTLE